MAGLSTVSDDWQTITTNDILTGLKYNTDFISGGVEPVYFIADKSISVNYSNDSIQNCTKILANLLRSNDSLTIKIFETTGENKYTVGKASNIQYVARYIDSYLETITNTYTATIPLDVSEKIGKYDTRFTSNALGGQLICRITSDEIEYLRAFTISSQTIVLKDIVTGANSGIGTLTVNDRFELINAYDILEEGLEETTGYPVQGFVKKHVKPGEDTSYIEFGKYDTPNKLSGEKVVISYNAIDDYNQTFIYDDSINKYGIFPKNEELNFSVTQAQINQVEATLKKFTDPKITIDLETYRPTRPQKGWYVNVDIDGLVTGIFKIVSVSETYIHTYGQLIDKPFRLWKVRLTNYENNLASVLAGLKRRNDLGKSKLATNQILRTAIDFNLQFRFIDDPSEFTLDVPTSLDATSITNDDFTANWTAVPNADDYIIVASLSPTFDGVLDGFGGIYTGDVLSILVDGQEITDNDTFYYKVKAVNTDLGLESDFSNVITVEKYPYPVFSNNHAWDLVFDNSSAMSGSGLSITDSVNSIVANFYRNTGHDGASAYPTWVFDATFGNGIKFDTPASALRISDNSVIDITNKETWLFVIKFTAKDIKQNLLTKVSNSSWLNNAYQLWINTTNTASNVVYNSGNGDYGTVESTAIIGAGDLNVIIGLAFQVDMVNHTAKFIKNQTTYSYSLQNNFAGVSSTNNSDKDLFIGSFLWENGTAYIPSTDTKAEIYGLAMIKDALTESQIKAEFSQMGLT